MDNHNFIVWYFIPFDMGLEVPQILYCSRVLLSLMQVLGVV
jgi:hypothetical protein